MSGHLDGTVAAVGETAQVWMRRGEQAAYRYLGATSRRTHDGWDTLGDLGFLDDDGHLTLVERAVDVIDRDGTTVCPSRVEHARGRHPAVRDAATLIEFVRPRLTAAELPSHIGIRRSPLRNQAGKVRRSTFRTTVSTTKG